MYLASNEIIKQVKEFDLNKVSADVRNEFTAGIASEGGEHNRVLTVSGNVATINISGMLTKSYTLMTYIMGGTAYTDISNALALAENDPEIDTINMNMDSGGGQVAGIFNLISEMQAMTKPINGFVSGMCCSAMYAIAAQCASITASSEGETIGSVGIVQDMYIDENEISVTSTNAPNKRPDAKTEDGIKAIRAELDQFEELFLEAIATGRNTTVENVIANYKQGATTTARNALKSGMIDGIKTSSKHGQNNSGLTLTANNEDSLMNIAELQAKHPELFAEVKALGVSAGKKDEQARVSAFADLGEASGASELAMACIQDGTEHSANINAKFAAFQMKNQALANMSADNVDVANIDNVAPAAKVESLDDLTAAAMSKSDMEIY